MRNLKLREKYQPPPPPQKKRNPIKLFPSEKISIPENLTPFRKLQSSQINHPENISLPTPRKSFKSPEQTKHYGNNPNPPEKIPNTSESISTPPKKFKPLPELP